MAQRRISANRPGQAGFALPVVLLITAVLGFTMLTVITSLTGLRRETKIAKQTAEFEREALTAEARFQFLAITEPFGSDGLYVDGVRAPAQANAARTFPGWAIPQLNATGSVLRLDNRPYRWKEQPTDEEKEGGPAYRVAVQDEAGLVNLYHPDTGVLMRLFTAVGLGDTDATNLASDVIAYIEEFGVHEPMRRASELYRIESARNLLTSKMWRALSSLAVAYPDSTVININTAPADVLKIWFDIDDDQAAAVVDARAPDGDTTGTGVVIQPQSIGAPPLGVTAYAFPNGRLRFSFTDTTTGQTYQSSLVVTPYHVERPFWTENARTLPNKTSQPSGAESEHDLQDFMDIPSLAS